MDMLNFTYCTVKLTEIPNDDSICRDIVKLTNEKKLSSPQGYFVNNENILHRVVREDDKA